MQAQPVIKRQKHGINQITLSASVPGEMARQVRLLARKRNVTASSIVTKALTMYLALADEGEERAA